MGHAPTDRTLTYHRNANDAYADGYTKGYADALASLHHDPAKPDIWCRDCEHWIEWSYIDEHTKEHVDAFNAAQIAGFHESRQDGDAEPNIDFCPFHDVDKHTEYHRNPPSDCHHTFDCTCDPKPVCSCPVTCFSYTNTKFHSNRYCDCAAHVRA